MKKLFLDDIRTIDMVYDPSREEEFDIVRSYVAFVEYIQKNGLPPFISFDNDLGLDSEGTVAPDGYAAAKWLVYESGQDLRNLEFIVHSANPVAAEQIRSLLNNYIQHLESTEYIPISAKVALHKLPNVDTLKKNTNNAQPTEAIIRYLNWKKSDNDFLAFCYAPFEIKIPKVYDFLIDLEDPTGGITIQAVLSHVIWNGMIPFDYLDRGHKQIMIIAFENSIPERLNDLKEIDHGKLKTRFALCAKSNKEDIIRELKMKVNL